MEQKRVRVAIIGAGLCGLTTLKECLAAGFEAVVLEARDVIGGGWTQQPVGPDTDPSTVTSAMYDGVVMNSCRDTSSFTDFPFDPSRYGDYFSHRKMSQYLHEYARHFGLERHVRLRTRVLDCAPVDGGSGGWRVMVQREGGGEPVEDAESGVFTAVCVAAGHLSSPKIPDFRGRDRFKGEFLHSHYYRRPGPYAGKKVAIIGLGSAGVDIASEIAAQASEVHIVTRRGGWILPRFILGKPTEAWDNRATQVWIPSAIAQWLQTKLLNLVEIKPPKELAPEHKILAQNVTIRGDFLEKVNSGLITPHRATVDAFTETGLALSTGETLPDVDVVIAATGYHQFDFPYLAFDPLRSEEETPPGGGVDLYKFLATPHYDNLFFVGYTELLGPLPAAAEAQARYIVALLEGRVPRASKAEMLRDVRRVRAEQERKYVRSERHTLSWEGIDYIDGLLRPLGAVPSFPKLLARAFTGNPVRALAVLNAVWFGIPSSAQWRLCGHGAKRELAEETVLRTAAGGKELSEKELRELGMI